VKKVNPSANKSCATDISSTFSITVLNKYDDYDNSKSQYSKQYSECKTKIQNGRNSGARGHEIDGFSLASVKWGIE